MSKVADHLKESGIKVFYDMFEEKSLWGKDLYEHLDYVYSKSSRFCVIFCSESYANKLWTNHERRSAQARAFEENSEYLLPVKVDNTEIPGIRRTVGYLRLGKRTPANLAAVILDKLRPQKLAEIQHRKEYLPNEREILIEKLKLTTPDARRACDIVTHYLFRALTRTNVDERFALISMFNDGCGHDLPENIHISYDLLRRITGWPPSKIEKTLGKLGDLGFKVTFLPKRKRRTGGKRRYPDYIYLRWSPMIEESDDLRKSMAMDFVGVAYAMIRIVRENYCAEHGMEKLMDLNFCDLSKQDSLAVSKLWCSATTAKP